MDKVYDFLMKDLHIKYGDSIVVAVSGGPDSMALLHILTRIKKALDIEIICAHVNHNTGRKGQLEEQQYVEKFCRNHNIIFETLLIEDYGDDNFENEARTKRYNYFEQIVKEYHAKYLFTAHHGDDLMETILMRMTRGSTLRGYSGFSKIVDRCDYKIVRPLIELTKEQLIDYNKKYKIHYFIDSTNLEDIHTRNRYRKYIVPEFKKEDPNVHKKFYKFSTILLEYNDYIDKQVEKIIPKVYPQNILNIEEFLKLDHVIAMKVIYYILEKIYQEDLMLITDHHADLIYQLITSKKANTYIYLPNNLKALKTYNNLEFINEPISNDEYEIEIIKYINLPNGKNIEVVNESNQTDNNICRLSSDDVKFPLRVRTRQNGDKMNIKGMLGSKKINDIFIDEKITVPERNMWPIVVDSNNTIVWLPGLKKSKFDKTKSEKYDIILRYY
jgi:tRNA(Ile)-lysidine synthase